MSRNIGGNPSSDGDKFKHSILTDAFDHESYLVSMCIKQYRWLSLLVLCSGEVKIPQRVLFKTTQVCSVLADDLKYCVFKS